MSDNNEVEIDIEKAIKDFCVEFSASCIRTEAERDFRKEAINLLSEKINVDKKTIAFCGKTYHKQDFNEKSVQQAELQMFYAKIFGEPDMQQEDDDDFMDEYL